MKACDTNGKFWRGLRIVKVGTVVMLAISLGLWTQPVRAEWHSLTGTLPEHVGNVDFIISPDSRMVAFAADLDEEDVVELYAVPITGTTPIKLNPPLVADGDITNSRIAFTPESQALIYLADQEVDNRVEMYRVPVTGGDAVKLNEPLVAGGNVLSFKIDADNERVVYLADQETNEVFELWSVPIAGGDAVKLNGALVTGGNISSFLLDPLSNRVVYNADQETNGKLELYSVPVAGGVALKLNPPIALTGGGDSGISGGEFAVNSVIPVVVFIARQAGAPGGRLYTIPTAGGDLTQLSFEMLSTQRILSFRISPTGDRVLFNVGTRVGGTNAFKGNLYSNLIGAGQPANVTETADPLFGTDRFEFLPDGSRVVYSFQNNADAPIRLEAATLLGVRTPLYVPDDDDDPLSFFRISPDSAWVMYQDLANGTPNRVYTIPPTGGGRVNFGPGNFKLITPDSSRIAFTRVVTNAGFTDLFTQQIFGGGERNLSDMGGTGSVSEVKVSADNAWFVFTVQIDDTYDLRVSDGAQAQPFVPPPDAIAGLVAANNGPKQVGTPISFTASITGGTQISYTWDFGDGAGGVGETSTHAYAEAGVYTATVVATNTTNALTATTTVVVGDAVVEVSNNVYTPQDVTVEGGGLVVWVLKAGFHSVTADDNSFEQPAGDDWPPFAHTFVTSGSPTDTTVAYHCTVHGAGMAGTVTVLGEGEEDRVKLLLPSLSKK